MNINNECCGTGPHTGNETRVYRLGPPGTLSGNLILCRACWDRENDYNRTRGRETRNPGAWPTQEWTGAEIYRSEASQ